MTGLSWVKIDIYLSILSVERNYYLLLVRKIFIHFTEIRIFFFVIRKVIINKE